MGEEDNNIKMETIMMVIGSMTYRRDMAYLNTIQEISMMDSSYKDNSQDKGSTIIQRAVNFMLANGWIVGGMVKVNYTIIKGY